MIPRRLLQTFSPVSSRRIFVASLVMLVAVVVLTAVAVQGFADRNEYKNQATQHELANSDSKTTTVDSLTLPSETPTAQTNDTSPTSQTTSAVKATENIEKNQQSQKTIYGITADKYSKTPPPNSNGFVNTDPTSSRFALEPLTLSATEVTMHNDERVYLTARSPHGLLISQIGNSGDKDTNLFVAFESDMVDAMEQEFFVTNNTVMAPGTYTMKVRANAGKIVYYAQITVHIVAD